MDIVLDTRGQRKLKSLLFIYLFIVNVAADCPRPPADGNMVLSREAQLMNEFPDNVDVTLECASGYVQESGSGTMSCIDQKWTEPDLICKKKDCGLPPAQPNMIFNASEGTLFGASLQVHCIPGYLISGSSYKQCFAFGWSGRSTCELATCEAPPEVQYGSSSWVSQENPEYGQSISYNCNEGFTLVGESSIMCMDTGEYNFAAPECKGVTNEGSITTEKSTSAPASPVPETSSSTVPPTTAAALRNKTVTDHASSTVSPSQQALTATDSVSKTRVTSPGTRASLQGIQNLDVNAHKHIGYVPAIVTVIAVFIVGGILAVFLIKIFLRRKGSGNGIAPI
ncbi:complement decay-accelerating factor-like isoform X2 [Cololabis saira]|uniref:complement decay-accelerating factor-like isoform X2 n=1 Tax=Cololabis saira TaxID=129043 RepID=UPI002AD316E0|nr:complement decay-accelerating factor-like isoform X2 [Cololabis saira]